MQIGYVGLGNMGGALARRLQLSRPLQVFDLNPASVASLVAAGATAASDLPGLARDCAVVFLCLPTTDHVEKAIFGPGGLIEGLKPGTVIIDQTTGFPAQTREIAKRLAEKGIDFVDAPVSGGAAGAAAGTIAIMVGALDAPYARVEPILKDISPNVFFTGGIGNGQVVKIANNLVSFTQRLVTYEAIALAAKNGVAPEITAGVLSTSTAQNGYMHRVLIPHALKGVLNTKFTLALTHKDMALACRLGEESEVPMAFSELARDTYQRIIDTFGPEAQAEMTARFYEDEAHTSFIPGR